VNLGNEMPAVVLHVSMGYLKSCGYVLYKFVKGVNTGMIIVNEIF